MTENTDTTRYPGTKALHWRTSTGSSPPLARAALLALCWLVIAIPANAEKLETAPLVTESGSGSESAADPAPAESEEAADSAPAESEEAADSAPAESEEALALELGEAPEEDILFQEIPSVYGVSKFEQKITEAPSFVTLITSDEISKYGYRTVAEALQSVTGFFVTYDRNYNYLGIRGFNRPGDFNTRVLLLVDGHRLNDNLYDQAGLGTEAVIDVDLIDRIEVIRGPSSSLYGTNAFFGVINVITKRGRDIRGTELSAALGSFDTYRVRGTYGDKFSNGTELLLSASYYSSQGPEYLYYEEFDDPLTNNGITHNADDDQFPNVLGKLSFRDFTLQGGFVSREKGIPTASYETYFPTDETRSLDQHGYVFLKYERQFRSQLNVFGRIYYDNFYYRGDYFYDYPPLTLNRDRSNGEWWGFEGKVDRRFFDSHNVTGGVEFRHNFRQDLWNGDVDPPPEITYLDDRRDTWNVALFVQDEFSILENLILNAGVRFDYYDFFGSTVNPRIALIYNLEKTTFKALYGRAFRRPNAYERFYVGTGFIGNKDLEPEIIHTAELAVEHALTPHIRATAAGYYYRINDLISQVPVDPSDPNSDLQFQNTDEVEAMGLEFQLEMDDRGPLGISGRLGYALQQTEDRETDLRLTNSPTHLLNLNVVAPIARDKFFGGVELLYASQRKTVGGDRTDHRVITNLTLFSKNILKGLELTASVRNLLDLKYYDPGSGEGVHVQDQIEQDGRSFWLKAKYGF